MYRSKPHEKPYLNLLIRLLVSLVIMYGVMFLNVDESSHIYLSLTRLYMAFLMMFPMAVLMVLTMRMMYTNERRNTIIVLICMLGFGVTLTLLRTQTPVNDQQYMKAMIPHHSSAIMVSRHARLQDPELKALADSIISSQRNEIQQMKAILERLKHQ